MFLCVKEERLLGIRRSSETAHSPTANKHEALGFDASTTKQEVPLPKVTSTETVKTNARISRGWGQHATATGTGTGQVSSREEERVSGFHRGSAHISPVFWLMFCSLQTKHSHLLLKETTGSLIIIHQLCPHSVAT